MVIGNPRVHADGDRAPGLAQIARAVLGSPTGLRVCRVGRFRGSDAVHAGAMTQGLLAIRSGPHPSRQDVRPPGIDRAVTSNSDKPGFGFPSCHSRAVVKSVRNSVGNSTRHPARMASAREEDFGTQWDTLARFSVSEEAAGPRLSRRDPSTRRVVNGGVRGDDRSQAWGAGLRRQTRARLWRRQRTHTHSPLWRLGLVIVSLATVLYGGCLSALAESRTTSRQSVSRAASQDRLTLSLEEAGWTAVRT